MTDKNYEPFSKKSAIHFLETSDLGEYLSYSELEAFVNSAEQEDFENDELLKGNCQIYWSHKLDDLGYFDEEN